MTAKRKALIAFLVLILVLVLAVAWLLQGDRAQYALIETTGVDPVISEPDAQGFPTVQIAEPVGWPADAVPEAAPGLQVMRFADGLDNPRVIHTLPNGDVLVALARKPDFDGGGGLRGFVENLLFSRAGAAGASADTLLLLRDADSDGAAEQRVVLSDELASPAGIAWRDGTLYVANHDALLAFPYALGEETLAGGGRKLMDLPRGTGHWVRNIELSPDGSKLYVAVGSKSNIGEDGLEIEEGRAMIWEYDLATNRQRPFASGLRNPNGLDFSPWSGELWTTVNERDMLGSDLVPDYLTNVPLGAHYGWPWYYWGGLLDERVEAPIPQFLTPSYIRKPEYALGAHVAALGFVFSAEGHRMGDDFGQGAFVARHGSWNRKPPSGYDVVYVRFDDRGNPVGKPVPVLTGFLTGDGTTYGRPTWVEWAEDGALLVSDDTAGIIWRVVAPGAEPAGAIERLRGESLRPRRELTDPRRSIPVESLEQLPPVN